MRSTPLAIALALVALGATVTPSLGQNPIDEFVCDFCQWMVGELEMLLEQGKTEADAIEFMLELCDEVGDILPGIDLAQTCKNFVNTYAKPAIDQLIVDTQPEHVCIALGICEDPHPTTPIMTTKPPRTSPPPATPHTTKPPVTRYTHTSPEPVTKHPTLIPPKTTAEPVTATPNEAMETCSCSCACGGD